MRIKSSRLIWRWSIQRKVKRVVERNPRSWLLATMLLVWGSRVRRVSINLRRRWTNCNLGLFREVRGGRRKCWSYLLLSKLSSHGINLIWLTSRKKYSHMNVHQKTKFSTSSSIKLWSKRWWAIKNKNWLRNILQKITNTKLCCKIQWCHQKVITKGVQNCRVNIEKRRRRLWVNIRKLRKHFCLSWSCKRNKIVLFLSGKMKIKAIGLKNRGRGSLHANPTILWTAVTHLPKGNLTIWWYMWIKSRIISKNTTPYSRATPIVIKSRWNLMLILLIFHMSTKRLWMTRWISRKRGIAILSRKIIRFSRMQGEITLLDNPSRLLRLK